MDRFDAEMEKEGWQVFDVGGGREEVQRIDMREDGNAELETDDQALDLAKLFLARKVVGCCQHGRLTSWDESLALWKLATAILNTEAA